MAMFLSGQRMTADALNKALPVGVSVTANAASIASSSSTYYAITWAALASSNGTSMWSAGTPTRLYAPTDGTYALSGFINAPGSLGSADLRGQFTVNGSSTPIPTAKVATIRGSTGNITGSLGGSAILNAGDYLELVMNQNVGGAVTLVAALSMSRVYTAIS